MGAAELDLTIEQGTDYELVLHLASKPPDPQPLDLTGYTARSQFRPNHGHDTAVLYELTTSNGRLTIDGPAGTITVTIPGEDSSAWQWRTAVYDLELVNPSGRPKRLFKGAVRVDPEVTR